MNLLHMTLLYVCLGLAWEWDLQIFTFLCLGLPTSLLYIVSLSFTVLHPRHKLGLWKTEQELHKLCSKITYIQRTILILSNPIQQFSVVDFLCIFSRCDWWHDGWFGSYWIFCCLKKVCEGGITSAARLSANFLQIEQNQRISGHGWNMETWKCIENNLWWKGEVHEHLSFVLHFVQMFGNFALKVFCTRWWWWWSNFLCNIFSFIVCGNLIEINYII